MYILGTFRFLHLHIYLGMFAVVRKPPNMVNSVYFDIPIRRRLSVIFQKALLRSIHILPLLSPVVTRTPETNLSHHSVCSVLKPQGSFRIFIFNSKKKSQKLQTLPLTFES